MALLVAFLGIAMMTMLLPVVLTQRVAATTDDQHAGALSAAQSGLDVAAGQLGTAVTGATGTALPCGPLTGTVGTSGGAGAGGYTVQLDYFPTDPTGLYFNTTTRAYDDAAIAGAHMSCTAGHGTGNVLPGYALLRSRGWQSAGGPARTLVATVTITLGNPNVPGGLIHIFRTANTQDLCLDAGSGNPVQDTRVLMQPCVAGSPQQQFAYTRTLSLVLTSSKTAANPLGMCLDAGPVPHSAGGYVELEPCAATTAPRQQWSYNDSANFAGTADGRTNDGYCFNVRTPNTSGSSVVLGSDSTGTCDGTAMDDTQSFSPEASVGAGMAGAGTGQLVNYQQFGRCLDVTGGDVTYGFLIAWPCKQAPDPATLTWNELWDVPVPGTATPVTGHLTTVDPSTKTAYCLDSPRSTAGGQYVTVTACSGASSSAVTWTVYAATGALATSYVIKDSAGYCLEPSLTDLFDNGSSSVSKIVVAVCDGTALQKWNAPAGVSTALTGIGER